MMRGLVSLTLGVLVARSAIAEVPSPNVGTDGHDRAVAAFAVNEQGTRIVTTGPGGRAIVWDVATRNPIASRDLAVEDEAITCAVFHPDGRSVLLGTGSSDGRSADVLSWSIDDGRLRRVARLRRQGIDRLILNADGTRFIAVGAEFIRGSNWGLVSFRGSLASLFELPSGRRLRSEEYEFGNGTPWFGFDDEGVALFARPERSRLVVRRFEDDEVVRSIALRGVDPDQNETGVFLVAQDLRTALRTSQTPWPAVVPEEQRVGRFSPIVRHDNWRLSTGREVGDWLQTSLVPATPAEFSPDGRLLAWARLGPVVVRRVPEWRELWTVDPADTPRVSDNPDAAIQRVGADVARRALGVDREVEVVTTETPRTVVGLGFSGDSRRLAVLTADPNLFRHTGFVLSVREAETGEVVSRWRIPCRLD